MLVAQIVATSRAHEFCLEPTATLADAAAHLGHRGSGAVVVSGDGGATALGIVTGRDVVRALATLGPAALDLLVTDLMRARRANCTTADTVESLVAKMRRRRVRHLPVEQHGRLVGLISMTDVVRAVAGHLSAQAPDA